MLNPIFQACRHLHRAPDDWTLGQYARHARKIALSLYALVVGLCLILGLAGGDPTKPFDEFPQPFTIYTVAGLVICSFVCGQCSRLVNGGARRLRLLMTIGFAFLAADNRALHIDPTHSIADHCDDAIILVYAIIGLTVVYRQRRHVLELDGFVRGVSWAMGVFVWMVVLDALANHLQGVPKGIVKISEECFKGLAISLLFCTFVAARFQLRRPERFPAAT